MSTNREVSARPSLVCGREQLVGQASAGRKVRLSAMSAAVSLFIALNGMSGRCFGDINDSLISYWKLDEVSGNALDAHSSYDLVEVSGNIDSTAGKVNSARDFEAGDTEYLAHLNNVDLTTGDIDFSIVCWIKAESLASFPVIANKGWASSLGIHSEWVLYQDTTASKLTFAVHASGSAVAQSSSNAISTGTWYFVAAGHSTTNDELWISVDAGTPSVTAYSGGVNSGAANIEIGTSSNQSLYWDGLIDEFGFWKRDIRSDLTKLHNSGNGLAYPFHQGAAYYYQQQSSIERDRKQIYAALGLVPATDFSLAP